MMDKVNIKVIYRLLDNLRKLVRVFNQLLKEKRMENMNILIINILEYLNNF